MAYLWWILIYAFMTAPCMAAVERHPSEKRAITFLEHNAPDLADFFIVAIDPAASGVDNSCAGTASHALPVARNIYPLFGEIFLFVHIHVDRGCENFDSYVPQVGHLDDMNTHLKRYFTPDILDGDVTSVTLEKRLEDLGRLALILLHYRPAYQVPEKSIEGVNQEAMSHETLTDMHYLFAQKDGI